LVDRVGGPLREVRVPRVALDDLEVGPEPRPAREAVRAGDDELGSRQPQGRRRRRVVLTHPRERFGVTRADSLEPRLRLLLEVLEAGILGKPGHRVSSLSLAWRPLIRPRESTERYVSLRRAG